MGPREKAEAAFKGVFGAAPPHAFRAPGRVNLIGEHTDYNDGFVLPVSIDFETVVVAGRRDDRQVRVVAADYSCEESCFSLDTPVEPDPDHLWANYIRGGVKVLLDRDLQIGGVDLAISGDVPQGAGLSSSASLEVAVGQAFTSLFDLPLSPTDIALIGQQAENTFVGVGCGIMDQLVCARGQAGHALMIDCRTLEARPVRLPQDLVIMIIDSCVVHGHVGGEYNERREQCEEAARLLGVKALRDISLEDLTRRLGELPPLAAKRARHVVSENERVTAAVNALETGDTKMLSGLMAASHVSMRDDFEISVPPIDLIVEIVSGVVGKRGGVRMTGGGFGGCVVALVPPDLVPAVKAALTDRYESETGLKETIYLPRSAGGAAEIRS
jgi:galactokinase